MRPGVGVLTVAVVAALLAGCAPHSTEGPERPTTETWPRISLAKTWSGLSEPLYLTEAPRVQGSGRNDLYVVEKGGRIKRIRDGRVEREPFLDLSSKVSDGSEQGLLGLAFSPRFRRSHRFYVDYTDRDGDTVIARYVVRADGSADADSERVVLKIDQPYTNHNGGQIDFGPDGMLYIGMGDGGSGGDPEHRAQDPEELLGKLLRIDVESVSDTDRRAYVVPSTNPFVGRRGWRPEIWDLGLRNPWRFSFDTLTGYLYIADVGQDRVEEIDAEPIGRGGFDYGWDRFEGSETFEPESELAKGLRHTPPVAEYTHELGASVTGGYVYDGDTYPKLRGVYLYGDYGSGRIWGLRRTTRGWQDRRLLDTPLAISSFGRAGGDVYVLDLSEGTIHKVVGH